MSRIQTAAVARSMDEIFESFDLQEPAKASLKACGAPVTIWLPAEYKARYDRLQEVSKKRFCKKVRELIQVAIDRCDRGPAKAS